METSLVGQSSSFGPRDNPDTLGPLDAPLSLKCPSDSGPKNAYLRGWETEAEAKVGLLKEMAVAAETRREPFSDHSRGRFQKAGNAKWIGPSSSPAWD